MTYTPTTTGTTLERFVGTLAGCVFSCCYFYSILWLPGVIAVFFLQSRTAALLLAVPYFVSAALPAKTGPRLLSTWFFKCMLKLHDFEEVKG